MKKLIVLVLVLALAFSMTACATDSGGETTSEGTAADVSDAGDADDNNASDTQDTENAEEDAEEVTLTVLTFFDSKTYGDTYEKAWEQVEEMTGYNIEVDLMGTDAYKTKMKVYLASGEMPDIMSFAGGTQSDPFIEKGLLEPAEDYIANSGYDFNEAFLKTNIDGHIYGMPATVGNSMFLYYNKAILDEYGLDVPQTMADFEEMAAALEGTGIAPIGTGVSNRWLGDFIYMAMVARSDPQAYFKAANGEISWDSEPFLNAAKKIQELVDIGAFNKDLIAIDAASMDEMFIAGQYATVLEGGWRWGMFYEDMGDNLGYAPYPNFFNDDSYTETALVNPSMFNAVSTTCSNKDAAFEVIALYSHLINESMAESGKITLIETDTQPTGEVYADYQMLKDDMAGLTTTVPSWSDFLDPDDIEIARDLAQQLFGKVLTAEEFVKQYDAMMQE